MLKWMKRMLFLAVAFCLMFSVQALAAVDEGVYMDNPEIDEWVGDLPDWWTLETDFGFLEQDEGEDGSPCALVTLGESGYALITQEIYLQPESVYVISCRVRVEGVSDVYPAANINIGAHPFAEDGFIQDTHGKWETMSLCIKTNVDDVQDYTLRIGLGNENNPTVGSVYIDSISVEKLEEEPDDMSIFPVIGSLSYSGGGGHSQEADPYAEEQNEETTQKYWHSAENVSYNDVGQMLFVILLVVAFCMLFRGKWAGKAAYFLEKKAVIMLLFAGAFILRLIIAANQRGHITDMNCFTAWAAQINEVGLGGFYDSGIFADYPPGYMYVLGAAGAIAKLLGISASSVAYSVLVRLPVIIADLVLAYVIYRIGSRHQNKTTGLIVGIFVLFMPVMIVDSAAWGQVDSVFILGCIASLYLLYIDKKPFAAMVWTATFFIKPQALIILPVFAIVYFADLFTKGKWLTTLKEFVLSVLGAAAVYLLLALPMMGTQDITYVITRMMTTTGSYALGSVNAFNLMALLGGNFLPDDTFVLFTNYKSLGIAFIVLLIACSAIFYFRRKQKKDVFLLSAFIIIGVFVLGHQMHERYILPGVIFLLVAAMLSDSKRFLRMAAVFSLLAYLNIYIVLIFGASWIPESIVYPISLCMVAAFGVLCYYIAVYFMLDMPGSGFKMMAEQLPPDKERRRQAAQLRLSEPLCCKNGKLTSKDHILMLIITLIYSAFAFTNLGSFVIPQRTQPIAEEASQIILELEEPALITQIKYYTGYCEGEFSVSTSVDGQNYEEWYTGSLAHPYANMFRWCFEDVEQYGRFAKIQLNGGYLEMREIGLMGEDGNLLPIVSATIVDENAARNANELIDEQDQIPKVTSHMTEMYFDEVYHARAAYEYRENLFPYETTHPPLGKSIIALGTLIFGFNPFGWRFMGALFGALQLPLLYILAKRLLKETKWAAVATVLFASDFMHFSLTRIATIDSFSIFFILAMYLFMYEYMQHNFNREKLTKTFVPLGLCGLCFGLGAATKWLCIYAGLGLCAMFFFTVYQRHQEFKLAIWQGDDSITANYKQKLVATLLFCVLVFIIVPVIIYCLSYIPYFGCKDQTFTLADIWHNQQYMLGYHGNLVTSSPHPYQSGVYTWPFSIRPMFFFMALGQVEGMAGVLWCMGNPVLCWGAVLALLYFAGHKKGAASSFKGMGVAALAALCGYIPWMIISREVYIYHYFAVIPFLALLVAYVLRQMAGRSQRAKWFAYGFVSLCVLAFVLFYPSNTGTLVPRAWAELIHWLPTWPL